MFEYVYMFGEWVLLPGGVVRVKIGTTRNLNKNLTHLKRGGPNGYYIWAFLVPPGLGREFEQAFHRIWKKFHYKCEWFLLPANATAFFFSFNFHEFTAAEQDDCYPEHLDREIRKVARSDFRLGLWWDRFQKEEFPPFVFPEDMPRVRIESGSKRAAEFQQILSGSKAISKAIHENTLRSIEILNRIWPSSGTASCPNSPRPTPPSAS
jgi:hypothetical protein